MYKQIIFPFLSRFDAEAVHEWTLQLAHVYGNTPPLPWLVGKLLIPTDPRLRIRLSCGLDFRSPIGVAAGFDKFGLGVPAFDSLGFSHVEAGTVPPLGQPGNPTPRLFRLLEDLALINRMGFNSPGALAVKRNLAGPRPRDFRLGISVGVNKSSMESGRSVEDYIASAKILAELADYIVINVSTPSTQGVRDLQHKKELENLLDAFLDARQEFFPSLPVFLKLAPDLTWEQLDDALEVALEREIAGLIETNSTFSREGLTSFHREEWGGMSGRPLFNRAREVVSYTYRRTEGRIPIFGVSGIFVWQDALSMITAGASVLQMLTGLVYEGILAGFRVNRGLSAYMDREGIGSIGEIVGQGTN